MRYLTSGMGSKRLLMRNLIAYPIDEEKGSRDAPCIPRVLLRGGISWASKRDEIFHGINLVTLKDRPLQLGGSNSL